MAEPIAKNLIVGLNSSLTAYLEVHQTVLHQKVGQELNYAELSEDLEDSAERIEAISNALGKVFKPEDYKLVVQYTTALLDAIEQFHKIVSGLRLKAENTGRYGFFAYRGDLKAYKALVKVYTAYGERLNPVMNKYLQGGTQ